MNKCLKLFAVSLLLVSLLAVGAYSKKAQAQTQAQTPPQYPSLNLVANKAQEKKKEAAPAPVSEAERNAAIVKAMTDAMDPGEGQKKLEFNVGTFDVKVRVWLDPSKPPIESMAVGVGTWVLGHRFIQMMLSGFVMGEPWNGIGYAGFDNIQKKYVACYMDSGGTGMEWYKGAMDPDGKSAKLTATINDAITLKPTKAEMRLSFTPDGDHLTELWEANPSGKMVKVMELQYSRKKS